VFDRKGVLISRERESSSCGRKKALASERENTEKVLQRKKKRREKPAVLLPGRERKEECCLHKRPADGNWVLSPKEKEHPEGPVAEGERPHDAQKIYAYTLVEERGALGLGRRKEKGLPKKADPGGRVILPEKEGPFKEKP